MRPYTLSEAEEKLLAMASDPLDKFDSVFTAIDSSDLQFGTVIDSDGNEVDSRTLAMARFSTRLTAAYAKMPGRASLKVITLSTIRWRRTTKGM